MLDKILNGVDRALAIKLMLFHIVVIAISNYLVQFKFELVGYPIAWAALTFPLVVGATDLTVRMVGKQMGRAVIALAFIPAIIVSMIVVYAGGAPSSVAIRIGLGSGMAYFVATLLDVYVFQYFREQYTQWWIAPAFSSIVTSIIDTYTFFFTAFAGGQNEFMAANWAVVATNQIIVKVLVSLFVILPAYGIVLNFIQNRILAKNSD